MHARRLGTKLRLNTEANQVEKAKGQRKVKLIPYNLHLAFQSENGVVLKAFR